MKKLLIITFLILIPLGLFSQTIEVTENLRLVSLGKIADVRQRLPELMAQHPKDPGVKLLLGVVLEDAEKALDIYKEIVREYPQSQWADNAFWRIVQYYAVLGDTTRAKNELDNFRVRYPASPFLGPAADVVRSSVTINRNTQRSARATTNQTEIVAQVTPERIERVEETIYLEDEVTIEVFDTEVQAEVISEPIIEDANQEKFFGLQVGVYQNKQSAEDEKQRFLNRRLRTEVIEREVDGRTMYAVVIGHYSSKDSAEMAKIIVAQQCNCEPIIYEK